MLELKAVINTICHWRQRLYQANLVVAIGTIMVAAYINCLSGTCISSDDNWYFPDMTDSLAVFFQGISFSKFKALTDVMNCTLVDRRKVLCLQEEWTQIRIYRVTIAGEHLSSYSVERAQWRFVLQWFATQSKYIYIFSYLLWASFEIEINLKYFIYM